jgi:predicted nucleic acid-binding protein
MILLDTNVISELLRKRPEPAVAEWLDKQPREELWTASVVLAELLSGISLMPTGRRQRALGEEVERMISVDFQDQILDFDLPAAREYGEVLAARSKIGRPIREFDAQIAAIARVHHATVATRDLNRFVSCGLNVIDPWVAKT